ncbi:MAG: hypothetical protein HYX76_09425 [Acidobacteria bacterium]|nr:hypothetical protein [Acidobacteriota bacterium]
MLLEPLEPVIVRVIEPPARETGVADIILQAVGLTGLLLIGAAAFGLALGAVFIWIRRTWPANAFNGEAVQQLHLTYPVASASATSDISARS